MLAHTGRDIDHMVKLNLGLLTVTGPGSGVCLVGCTLERAAWEGCCGLLVDSGSQAVMVGCSVRHMYDGHGCAVQVGGAAGQ